MIFSCFATLNWSLLHKLEHEKYAWNQYVNCNCEYKETFWLQLASVARIAPICAHTLPHRVSAKPRPIISGNLFSSVCFRFGFTVSLVMYITLYFSLCCVYSCSCSYCSRWMRVRRGSPIGWRTRWSCWIHRPTNPSPKSMSFHCLLSSTVQYNVICTTYMGCVWKTTGQWSLSQHSICGIKAIRLCSAHIAHSWGYCFFKRFSERIE